MGILATVKNTTVGAYKAASKIVGPHKTDICFGAGMLALGFGIFYMCKASTKLPEKTDNLQNTINDIAAKTEEGKLSQEEANKEIRNAKVRSGCDMAKDFVLGAGLTLGGVILIGKSYKDVKTDNAKLSETVAGLALAYGKLQDFTNNYRSRVVAEEGAEKDTHYAFGTTPTETTAIIVDENGKKVEQPATAQVVTNPDIAKDLSLICIYPGNPIWKNDPGMMLSQIKGRFEEAESMLYHKRKISRNDILDLFYIPKDYSPEGLRPGQTFDPKRTGSQIDYAVHFVSRDKAAKTKYIPQGATGLENYIIIELKNLNPDITVPKYRFQ